MNEIIKRMNEIRNRKAELRRTLETDTQADLDAITQELRELDEEPDEARKEKSHY